MDEVVRVERGSAGHPGGLCECAGFLWMKRCMWNDAMQVDDAVYVDEAVHADGAVHLGSRRCV